MSSIIVGIASCFVVVFMVVSLTVALNIFVRLIPKPSYRPPNFALLSRLLAEKQWRQADMETKRIILWTVEFPPDSDYMPSRVLYFFPCDVLHVIDHLWSISSNNQFGFTAQKQVMLGLELTQNKNKPWNMHKVFSEHVGWSLNGRSIEYENLNFSNEAPLGHLPAGRWWTTDYRVQQMLEILQRLERCDEDEIE